MRREEHTAPMMGHSSQPPHAQSRFSHVFFQKRPKVWPRNVTRLFKKPRLVEPVKGMARYEMHVRMLWKHGWAILCPCGSDRRTIEQPCRWKALGLNRISVADKI